MLGITAVRAWPLEALGAAAATMDASARSFLESAITVHQSADALTEWRGATRDAVAQRLEMQAPAGQQRPDTPFSACENLLCHQRFS